MSRLRLVIAFGAIGLSLTLLNHGCGTQIGRMTTAPPTGRPEPTQEPVRRFAAALPLPLESLLEAERIATEFVARYLTHRSDISPATHLSRLLELTTSAFADDLRRTLRTQTKPPNPDRPTSSTGTVTRLKIRFLATPSIQYEVTAEQQTSSRDGIHSVRVGYAITLIRERGTWQVDGLQPANAGNGGNTPP